MHVSYRTRFKSSLGSTSFCQADLTEPGVAVLQRRRQSQAHCCWMGDRLQVLQYRLSVLAPQQAPCPQARLSSGANYTSNSLLTDHFAGTAQLQGLTMRLYDLRGCGPFREVKCPLRWNDFSFQNSLIRRENCEIPKILDADSTPPSEAHLIKPHPHSDSGGLEVVSGTWVCIPQGHPVFCKTPQHTRSGTPY